jgi:predicted Zn finger-like uncharacterized protein
MTNDSSEKGLTMPETVHCSNCQAPFYVPDELLGRKVKCPACGGVFTALAEVTGALEPPTEDDPTKRGSEPAWDKFVREWVGANEDDPARPESRRERIGPSAGEQRAEADGWGNVATGARLYTVAHALYGAALLLLLVLVSVDSPRGSDGSGSVARIVLLIVAGLALLANWVLAVVAACFWVQAPARAGARPLGIALLVVGGLVLLRILEVLGFYGGLMKDGTRSSERFALASALFTALLEMTRLVLLGFFLRAVASNLARKGLRARASSLAIGTPCIQLGLLLVSVLFILVEETSSRSSGGLGVLVLFLNVVGQAGLLLWGLLVLSRVRQAVLDKAQELESARS